MVMHCSIGNKAKLLWMRTIVLGLPIVCANRPKRASTARHGRLRTWDGTTPCRFDPRLDSIAQGVEQRSCTGLFFSEALRKIIGSRAFRSPPSEVTVAPRIPIMTRSDNRLKEPSCLRPAGLQSFRSRSSAYPLPRILPLWGNLPTANQDAHLASLYSAQFAVAAPTLGAVSATLCDGRICPLRRSHD